MAGIGMEFAATPAEQALIEETLFHASEEGMDRGDLRVLAILVHWLGEHYAYVHAERLHRLVEAHGGERVLVFWAAVGISLGKDNRWKRFARLFEGERIDLLETGTGFHVGRHGEDERFEGSPLCGPGKVLRTRASNILTREALARWHHGYRNRIAMGPNWRADAWTALERQPHLSAAELARTVGCGVATAWIVRRDFELLGAAKRSA